MTIKELMFRHNHRKNMEEFTNPDNKPLQELKIKYKSSNSCYDDYASALNERWCNKDYVFTLYLPPPLKNSDGEFTMGSKEDWLARMNFFIGDMQILLQMKYYRFWSEVVFNKQCLNGVNSFLQNAPPFYLKDQIPQDKDVIKFFRKAQELVFLVLVRLTTAKESEKAWMKANTLGSILYDNFVLSLPQLMEISLIYACDNFKEVSELIANIIDIQPKYLSDIRKSAPFICEVFTQFEAQLSNPIVEEDGVPSRISSRRKTVNSIEVVRLTYLMLDISFSLGTFLEVCPQAAVIFHTYQLEPRIASFYENTVPELSKHLNTLFSDQDCHENLENYNLKLNLSRHQLITSVHRCLTSCISSILEDRDLLSEDDMKNRVENYVQTITDCISDPVFMKDFNSAFPVQRDLNILSEIYADFDTVKCDYIIQSILSLYDLPTQKPKSENHNSIVQNPCPSSSGLENYVDIPMSQQNSECSSIQKVTGVELDSLITEVKDILPHLGDGFIVKCLEYFSYTSADVINAILENNLPEHLSSLDTEMPIIPPELDDKESEIPERVNIFDNDEFDIMTKDKMDTSRIHKGKRPEKHKNLFELLDDKSHINQLRDKYTQLSLVECVENVNDYEDEYDDTYDDIDVPVGNEGETEQEERRGFVTPRVLQQYKKPVEEFVEYVDESAEEREGAAKRDLFVENPEDVRARWEQCRLDKRGGRGGRNRAAFSQRDVVGKPKGHGQEKEVLVNREFKNTNKASRGNHNRRSMADRKRRQGMFPT